MKITKLILGLCFFISLPFYAQGRNDLWPCIVPERLSYTLSDASLKSICHIIEDSKGQPAYLLQAYINAYEYASPTSEHLLSGDFECVLTPLYGKVDGINLFTNVERPKRDWENRARFLLEEFAIPSARQIPGWGSERLFSLRGMDIAIKINNYKLYAKEKYPWWAIPEKQRLVSVDVEFVINRNVDAKNTVHVFPVYNNNK